MEKEKLFAISNFAKSTLEILDNFDRCFKNYEKPKTDSENPQCDEFYSGIEMIHKGALNVFKRGQIEMIECEIGSQVDFDFHEVVFVVPVPDKEDNEILEVV